MRNVTSKAFFVGWLLVLVVSCSKNNGSNNAISNAINKNPINNKITEEKQTPPPELNDSGITWGANYPKGINSDCSAVILSEELPESEIIQGDILSSQDCTHGRDRHALDDKDGSAGLVYQKINYDGQLLPADAEKWFCVLDKISGLLWEVKQASNSIYGDRGLQDADDLFTWYNSSARSNGGAIGDWNKRFNQCTGYTEGQPTTYCNIEEFVNRVNRNGLCGFKDWRMPTRPELESLVHFGRTNPAIDKVYFPNTQNKFYWSNSATAGQKLTAWTVNFEFGFTAAMPRSNGQFARLVRTWANDVDIK